ncbi:hypothetical protein AB1Y20_016766 [Prymnesium parvum]|uniref:Post-GPI attachment to proteins factor 3 n=1 Tax=Prymnesium parvum TaxID=97485 RepID=A0AB34IC20_PRYPA
MYRFFSLRKNCPSRWAAPLRRERLYAASCLAFCLLGAWTVRHAAAVHAWLAADGGWPYFSERMLVVHGGASVLQGGLSFGSDVLLVGKPSLLHLADRVLAVVLTLLGVYIEGLVLLCGRLSLPLQALMAGLLCASLAHHFRAKAAIRDQVYHTYVWSHTLWHLGVCASFPIPMTLAIGPRVILGLE